MSYDTLQDGLNKGISAAVGTIQANPVTSAVVAAGTVAAGVLGTVALVKSAKKRKKKKKSKRKYSRKKSASYRGRRRRKRKSRRTPRTAGKGKDRSHKRIRYTKKGQPYVIMGNGRARFIKKSSAKRSHKMKGGRY